MQRLSPPASRTITKFHPPPLLTVWSVFCSNFFLVLLFAADLQISPRRRAHLEQTIVSGKSFSSSCSPQLVSLLLLPPTLFHSLTGGFLCASLFTIRRNRHRRPLLSPGFALGYVEDNDNSSSVTHLGAIHSFDQFAHNTSTCDNSPYLVAS